MVAGRAMKIARRPLGFSMRVLGGRLGASWERDRRDTLFLMGAVALSVLPQVAFLPLWCSAGFFVLFSWRLGLVFSGHALPGAPLRMLAAAAIVGAVFAQYHSLLGREAGVALLVLFLGLKLMEMRARRDLFVVIFLCCFLLLTSYFHSQGIFMALATMIAVLTLVASMLTMQFRHEEIPVTQRLRHASVLLLQAIPIAAALFVLFPRPSGPLWGLPDDAFGASTGLSDSMTPGEIASLAESEEVVMRVGIRRTRSTVEPDVLARAVVRGFRRQGLAAGALRRRPAAAAGSPIEASRTAGDPLQHHHGAVGYPMDPGPGNGNPDSGGGGAPDHGLTVL
jgi:hypothetical protein